MNKDYEKLEEIILNDEFEEIKLIHQTVFGIETIVLQKDITQFDIEQNEIKIENFEIDVHSVSFTLSADNFESMRIDPDDENIITFYFSQLHQTDEEVVGIRFFLI